MSNDGTDLRKQLFAQLDYIAEVIRKDFKDALLAAALEQTKSKLAALTREAAPQASGGDGEVEELFRRLTRDDSTPDEIESRMKLRAIIRRLATTDSAQVQPEGDCPKCAGME